MRLIIKSEEEYDSALTRIHDLWDAKPESPEGMERDALFDAVEQYEADHYPIDDPESYAAIEYHLDRLNLTIEQLPISDTEKSILADSITNKTLVPESLVRKLSGVFEVSREALGISDESNGDPSANYVLRHDNRSH